MPLIGERLEGLTLGARALTQLRLSVEILAGRDAVRNLMVVVHLHEGQKEGVITDMVNHGHYGLNSSNVFITVQQRQPGYRCACKMTHVGGHGIYLGLITYYINWPV
jgi:hypothetical protein